MRTLTLISLLGIVAASACASAEAAPGPIAFTNVSVLPMDREGVLENQTVVVLDGLITEVEAAGNVRMGAGTTIIDGTGQFLMPGLAEMHAHVPPQENPPREAVEDILFLYLANGITTIRGMLGSAYQIPLADEIERNEVLGPNFYVGAPSLNGTSARTPQEAERLVRANKEAGYDLQKIHPGVPLESWDRMVKVAREVGLTYAGHVPADVGLVHALETGISTVDHMDGYVIAVASDAVLARGNVDEVTASIDPDEEKIQQIVDLSVHTGVFIVPTVYLWENLRGNPDPGELLSQPEMQYVSREQRDAWRRRTTNRSQVPPEAVAAHNALRLRILKSLSDAGANILMGTDSPQVFNVPGFSLHRELALMARAGMTNHQILLSGTVNSGRYVREHLGIDHQFGTVASGQRADLLLLGSNPLEDLDNLTDLNGVMVRGQWVDRAAIDARLAAIAAKHSG